MLTMTPSAAEAVRQLAGRSGLEPDPGLRISPGETSDAGTELRLDLVPGPEESDETVEEGGATVYVEPQLSEFLEDKVLDADIDSGRVRFMLGESPGDEEPASA